jgi:basic membrane lipoprotein Med (substrate-binding protein (PBP1-ABC) superfamily)
LPESKREGNAALRLSRSVDTEAFLHDLETQVAYVDSRALQEGVRSVGTRLRNEGVGLVVALGDGPDAQAIAKLVRGLPETRFLFVDASLRDLSLEGVQNAAAVGFAEDDALLLGGYASGLMPTMDGSARRIDRVSIVAAEPDDRTARLVAGFTRGLRETNPGATVSVDYSRERQDPTA